MLSAAVDMLCDNHAGAEGMTKLELQCPALNPELGKLPQIPVAPAAVKTPHPPIAAMLRANMAEEAAVAAEAREQGWKVDKVSCGIPPVHRGVCA